MTARPLAIAEDADDDLEAPEPALTPTAWEAFNARAVWCSLEGVNTDRNVLRVAIAQPYAVLEAEPEGHARERALMPSTEALGWFWHAAGLHSSFPLAPPELDAAACTAAVEAWLNGEEPDLEGVPHAVRLKLGWGEEVLRHEYLLQSEGGWMRGRRLALALEGEPTAVIDQFSMKQLVLDLSVLLALTLDDDPSD